MAAWERMVETAVPGGGSSGTATGAGVETMARRYAEEALNLMRRKTAAMQRILGSLAQPGRRTIFVYVSENFPLIAGKQFFVGAGVGPTDDLLYNTQRMLDAIVRTANAMGARFYSLRPDIARDPFASSGNIDEVILGNEGAALGLVAEETGGLFGQGPGGVSRTIDRIASDAGSYYSMAY